MIANAFRKLLGKGPSAEESGAKPAAQPEPPAVKSILDFTAASDIALGVKFTSRYGWYISPPAGWRRLESASGLAWPSRGVSPHVTFTHPSLPPGEQASVRWQLSSTVETAESHAILEDMLCGKKHLSEHFISMLEAPGLVTGMKINRTERLLLPTGQAALLVSIRHDQCRSEPAVLRHVFILPDRNLTISGQTHWYRETVQFFATENCFWVNERLVLESIKTFRRAVEDQTTSGSFAAISVPPVPAR